MSLLISATWFQKMSFSMTLLLLMFSKEDMGLIVVFLKKKYLKCLSQHCSSKVFSIEQMCRYRTVIWPVAERETSAETWNSCTAMISLGFHYEACNEADKMDFEKAIETIAVAFSSK